MREPVPHYAPHQTIVLCVGMVHLSWAVLLASSYERPFLRLALPLIPTLDFLGGNAFLLTAILFGVCGCATWSLLIRGPRFLWARVLLLLPQQFLLAVSAMEVLLSIVNQVSLDGQPRPWFTILGNQMPGLALAVIHTFAIFDRFGGWCWTSRPQSPSQP